MIVQVRFTVSSCGLTGRDQRGRPETMVVVEASVGRPPLHRVLGAVRSDEALYAFNRGTPVDAIVR
jgi:hypothetical protein